MKINKKILPKNLLDIIAFNTLRECNDSNSPYDGNNCCDYTGDAIFHALANKFDLAQTLGVGINSIFSPLQVHGNDIKVIDEKFLLQGVEDRAIALKNYDAIVTNQPNIVIGVHTADCLPIVLCDEEAKVIGVAHAGWRGTVGKIARNTVEAMQKLGADPKNIIVGIGPAICFDCFEIGDEVVAEFETAGFLIDDIMERIPRTGKAHIDLQKANQILLKMAGISAENIWTSNECTKCKPLQYYSARELGINSGRNFTGIIRFER